jgi:hypothetical protein
VAITQRTATSGTVASGSATTITLPTGTTTGDFIVIAWANATSASPATPTGWTQIAGSPFLATGSGLNQQLGVYTAPWSAGLTLSFTNAASLGAWVCNAYTHDPSGTGVVIDGTPVATILTTSSTTLPTGAPTTGATAGDYEVLAYGWPTASVISTVATGSTIDITQANSTSTTACLGHNNTTSLGASTTTTAFSQTLNNLTSRKIGVGILLATTGGGGTVTHPPPFRTLTGCGW